ncbi:MAG: acyltransferase [Victivallales bacterium]
MDDAFRGRFRRIGVNVTFDGHVEIPQPEFISIGDNVRFYHGVCLQSSGGREIVIGSKSHFAPYCVLYGPLEIGEGCCVAAHAVFAGVGHQYDDPSIPFADRPGIARKIVIEDNVWIGANAVIIQGVRVGSGSIIGAGAVVTKDVEPYSVMGGVPARLIKRRLIK